MSLENLLDQLPDYAKDVKLNVKAVLTAAGAPELQQKQIYGVALASAYVTKNKKLIEVLTHDFRSVLGEADYQAIKAAAGIMAMNNVYYHFLHLAEEEELKKMSINLQMSFMANPGVSRLDFALYSLAVSILNGCGYCVRVHTKHVISATDGAIRVDIMGVQSVARIASVINSLSQILIIEQM